MAEDAPVGTPVGTAAALDLDGGPLTYALTAGNAAGAFALEATSGMLTVAGALDYETTASYALTLTASDAHGGDGDGDGDRHSDGRARRADVRGGQLRLQRGRRRGGRRSGRDGSGHRRQRAVADARADGGQPGRGVGTGRDERRAEAGGGADYETTASYHLIVEARSGPAAAAAVPVTITVTNVDEPPAFGAESYAFRVAEDAAVTTRVGTVTARDPEGGTVVYDLTAGNEGQTFAVHALTGSVVVGAPLNHAARPSYTLTIKASVLGGGGPAAMTTVTVTSAG